MRGAETIESNLPHTVPGYTFAHKRKEEARWLRDRGRQRGNRRAVTAKSCMQQQGTHAGGVGRGKGGAGARTNACLSPFGQSWSAGLSFFAVSSHLPPPWTLPSAPCGLATSNSLILRSFCTQSSPPPVRGRPAAVPAPSPHPRCVCLCARLRCAPLPRAPTAPGEFVSVKLIRDKITGMPAGYGFAEFKSQEAASRALATLNGCPLGEAACFPPRSRAHPRAPLLH